MYERLNEMKDFIHNNYVTEKKKRMKVMIRNEGV